MLLAPLYINGQIDRRVQSIKRGLKSYSKNAPQPMIKEGKLGSD